MKSSLRPSANTSCAAKWQSFKRTRSLLAVAAGALVACGGGGGDTGTPAAPKTPTAATCAALKSGSYRIIAPMNGSTLAEKTDRFEFDAVTLTTVDSSKAPLNWVAEPTDCEFKATTGDKRIVVSQGGVIVGRFDSGASFFPLIGFRVQNIVLDDLDGTWNGLGFENNGTVFAAVASRITFGVDGVFTAWSKCQPVQTCAAVPFGTGYGLRPNANGGFDVGLPGVMEKRAFAYEGKDGYQMIVMVSGNGSFSVWSKLRTLMLPETTDSFQTHWTLEASNQMVVQPVDLTRIRVESVSPAASGSGLPSTFTRTAYKPNVTPDNTHTEIIKINTPRNGYQHRDEILAATTPTGTILVPEWDLLFLRGMEMSVLSLPGAANPRYMFSVAQP